MPDYKINSVLSLKDVLFLSMLDSYFPVKRYQDVSAMPTARIPKSYAPEVEKPSDSFQKSYVPKIEKPSDSAPEVAEKKNHKKTDEEDRPNIRVGSTPRPRAVISSPDNDAVIGNKNRIRGEHGNKNAIRGEHHTALKNHNMVQNRHINRSHILSRSPVKTRKCKDDAESNLEMKGKKGSGTTVSSRRRRSISERPDWQDP